MCINGYGNIFSGNGAHLRYKQLVSKTGLPRIGFLFDMRRAVTRSDNNEDKPQIVDEYVNELSGGKLFLFFDDICHGIFVHNISLPLCPCVSFYEELERIKIIDSGVVPPEHTWKYVKPLRRGTPK